jgi:hypothetical protein
LFRIGTSGMLLWMRQWTFRFHEKRGISWLAEWLSFSRRSLQLIPVHIFTFCLFKIRFNVILPSVSSFPKWFLPFRFFWPKICISPLSHACYMPCHYHSLWLDHPNVILWRLQFVKFLIT